MGKVSLKKLRKQVKMLEERNKKADEIKKLRESAENERKILNAKLKKLKFKPDPVRKVAKSLRSNLSRFAKKSAPLAKRIKKALDEASERA